MLPPALRLAFVHSFALPLVLAQAQPPAPALDNLVHAASYQTAAPDALGDVVARGSGPIDMVLVSGFGLGASAFAAFLRRNEQRYRMLAITLPGCEGTAAPPMPAAGTSYGEQTWNRAAVQALARLIADRKLDRPVVVGHFLHGTQVAAMLAIEHPELTRALVLLAGSVRFEPVESTPNWPRGLSQAKRASMVDSFLAPRWFKTVTRQTWVANNFVAGDFSTDAARGKKFADLANEPPLPVLVRSLCEFHASDVLPGLAKLELPLLLIQPGFTKALLEDKARSYLRSFFVEPWQGQLEARPHTQTVVVPDAGIMVMDDKPGEVDAAIESFLQREATPPSAASGTQPELREIRLEFAAGDGVSLVAKLTLPNHAPGPVPVVYYLHGAGPRTYDNPVFHRDAAGKLQVSNYLDYHATELARRGVGLCRMSKRGCTPIAEPPGMQVDREVFAKATMGVLLDDYARGLAALRARREIDPRRIVLLGSSEGTRLAPQLALRAPEGIVGVAMMSYAADNARLTVEWQNSVGPWRNVQHLLPAARDGALTQAEYDAAARSDPSLLRALPLATLDADHDGTLTPDDMSRAVRPRLDAIVKAVHERDDDFLWHRLGKLSSAYLLDWWEAEPNQAILARLSIPLAIFHGELDGSCRVEGVRETEVALRAAGKTNLVVHVYPGADHDLDWTLESVKAGVLAPFRDAFDLIATWGNPR